MTGIRSVLRRVRLGGVLAGLFVVLTVLAVACSNDGDSEMDVQLRAVIEANGLTGDPAAGRDIPDIDSPIAQLGMKLFYTTALGGEGDSACVTCHHPALGGGDGLSMAIGVGADEPELLGPGRTHPEGPLIPRNSPSTFNVALWDEVLFWDGRIESLGKTTGANGDDGYGIRTPDRPYGYADAYAGDNLAAAQSRFPLTAEDEMRGFDFGTDAGVGSSTAIGDRTRDLLAETIGGYGERAGVLEENTWPEEFRAVFGGDVPIEEIATAENIAAAIGEYERSQVFVDTPWRAYIEGDDGAISDEAKSGALLFYGSAGCAVCHSGDFMTDEQFHVLAIPQIGRGKASGANGDDDWGRYLETHLEEDQYAFRTPTLLNLGVTGPYGHDGAYATIEEIVRHHLDPAAAIAAYDFEGLDSSIRHNNAEEYTLLALQQLEDNRAAGILSLPVVSLTDEEIDQLLAFLDTLTDPCVTDRECLSPWIPDESVADPDGLRLVAIDGEGNTL